MAMISATEARHRGICAFCETPVHCGAMNRTQLNKYMENSFCASCRDDFSKMDAVDLGKGEQLDFKLSSKSPIPIDVPGATNM
ncbi:hypothetical protein LCGC14_3019240, partial [marine sediment metagenome]